MLLSEALNNSFINSAVLNNYLSAFTIHKLIAPISCRFFSSFWASNKDFFYTFHGKKCKYFPQACMHHLQITNILGTIGMGDAAYCSTVQEELLSTECPMQWHTWGHECNIFTFCSIAHIFDSEVFIFPKKIWCGVPTITVGAMLHNKLTAILLPANLQGILKTKFLVSNTVPENIFKFPCAFLLSEQHY